MQKTISRDKVIQAIMTEPLTAERWVEQLPTRTVKTCAVCAVGAVLRKAGLSDNDISIQGLNLARATRYGIDDETDESLIEVYLEEGFHLAALSARHETWWADSDASYNDPRVDHEKAVADHRKKLVKWIKKNLPSRIKLSVTNA